jgi:hypothetical protein
MSALEGMAIPDDVKILAGASASSFNRRSGLAVMQVLEKVVES